MEKVLKIKIKWNFKVLYLGKMPPQLVGFPRIYMFRVMLVASKKAIAKKWLCQDSPTLTDWFNVMHDVFIMEKLTYDLRLKSDVFDKCWRERVPSVFTFLVSQKRKQVSIECEPAVQVPCEHLPQLLIMLTSLCIPALITLIVSILTLCIQTICTSFTILSSYVLVVLWQPLIITIITILIITGVEENCLYFSIGFNICCAV